MSFRERNWENKYCTVPQPTRIPLPCKAESISPGRSHLWILDSDNLVWELTAWGLVRFSDFIYPWSMALNLLCNLSATGLSPHCNRTHFTCALWLKSTSSPCRPVVNRLDTFRCSHVGRHNLYMVSIFGPLQTVVDS